MNKNINLLAEFNSDNHPLPCYMDMINTVLKKEGLSYDFSFDDFFGQWCPYTWTVSELQDIFLTELGIDGKLEIEDLQKVKRWAGLFMEEQVKKYKSTFVVLLR